MAGGKKSKNKNSGEKKKRKLPPSMEKRGELNKMIQKDTNYKGVWVPIIKTTAWIVDNKSKSNDSLKKVEEAIDYYKKHKNECLEKFEKFKNEYNNKKNKSSKKSRLRGKYVFGGMSEDDGISGQDIDYFDSSVYQVNDLNQITSQMQGGCGCQKQLGGIGDYDDSGSYDDYPQDYNEYPQDYNEYPQDYNEYPQDIETNYNEPMTGGCDCQKNLIGGCDCQKQKQNPKLSGGAKKKRSSRRKKSSRKSQEEDEPKTKRSSRRRSRNTSRKTSRKKSKKTSKRKTSRRKK